MIFGKIWGTTEPLLITPMVEVHRLTIKPNHFCSMHVHDRKWNDFHVQRGKLLIEVRKNNYPLTDTTVLRPGEYTKVRPGEFHRFVTEDEETVALEIYYLEALSDDIRREDHGGARRDGEDAARLVSTLGRSNNRGGSKRPIRQGRRPNHR
jgi:mannose-6-phosphate isomerase-like protein (cupin superfamily)